MKGSFVPSSSQRMRLSIRISTITRLAIAIAAVLVVLSYSGQLAVRAFDWHPERDIVQFFNLDRERNMPTTFQSLLFLASGLSLAGTALMKRLDGDAWSRHWALLSGIFVLLAWDEMAELHERLNEPLRRAFDLSGVFFFGWIIPAAIAITLIGIAYLRFVGSLAPDVRVRFLIAAVMFLSGALLLEGVGGWYYESIDQSTDMVYVTVTTVEEILEMSALILFLHTTLGYLSRMMAAKRIELTGEPGRLWIDARRDVDIAEAGASGNHAGERRNQLRSRDAELIPPSE